METVATTLGAELDARLLALYWLVSRGTGRDMSRSAASVLATLRDAGPQRITELATIEAVAQPTMTTLVGRLERDGLVERTPDPDDGRAVRVAITTSGLELLGRAGDERRAIVQRRIETLDNDARRALMAALPALDKLIHAEKDTGH